MSTTDLYVLNKVSTTHLAEFRNGHGSGPAVWDYLGDKYIPEKPVYSLEESHMKKVWALHDDDRLAEHEKIAMLMTFDRAYVPLANLLEAGHACIKFGKDSDTGERVNHWVAIGEALIAFSKVKHHRFARGVCMSCTSVSDNWGWGTDWPTRAWSIYDE